METMTPREARAINRRQAFHEWAQANIVQYVQDGFVMYKFRNEEDARQAEERAKTLELNS